ncbi:MAG TPA: tRNA (adenosine(37)-N6)-threonylcarbamoyltransferase complex dimerization subunit type 1 TsaB [Polyangiaceae bacterium]|nr:tRNA (adenosine(37)-N6)-threonylcarbamoyltransferase complex dimerization subunit type 1 TsaB [Polyangiaceae bacterium]
MRILGIETCSRRGSVALCTNGELVARSEHSEPSAHAERMLTLVEQALSDAGWARSSLDRIAVGIGPGSFVGLRVGIALAEGLGLGLGRPVVGVVSLHAMLAAVPKSEGATRVALLDARRGELFVAARNADGRDVLEPRAVARGEIGPLLAGLNGERVLVGEVARDLALPDRLLSAPDLDLPDARWVAELGATLSVESAPALPLYVRGPGATRPNLPPSPFAT